MLPGGEANAAGGGGTPWLNLAKIHGNTLQGYKTFTLRWKKTGRRELKRPEKQYSASVQVNQKSQDNLHAGGPGSRAAVRPEGVRYIPFLCQIIKLFNTQN